MECPRCSAPNIPLLRDEDGEYYKCYSCGRAVVVAEPELTAIIVITPKEPNSRPISNGYTPQAKAMHRYRNSELFKKTNARIQKRYNHSEKGKETRRLIRRRNIILEKLAKRTEVVEICESHDRNILINNKCAICLAGEIR